MSLLNLDAFRAAPLTTEPFPYMILPGFVRSDAVDALHRDYPRLALGGSFPLASVSGGPMFDQMAQELRGERVRAAFAEKFGVDLADRPTTLTVRGRCRKKDGKVHTDSRSKLITVLVYMNGPWEAPGGRLRLLKSNNINDVICEAPPEQGTLVAFRNDTNAWHGHLPFEGERRALQLNWVKDEAAVLKSERRHGWSAWLKRFRSARQAA
ncbi:hypothetical protein Pla175_11560 [Pirellulimonas nuda]|uniref:Prolyl 4-hydroxylase alpha subunit Fe(2+) 2OG dioxygenase domain-containing protein n=1 Tax=Pirellulimonas nuda TaxID=2528009 RepID=A0A518D8I0_9BACT|nr:2OG-Fe(II) oxygenase [Pirellulimonas nuda]QDU87789.1 hypothetical protein Pla175_11560 [Pirellulimonas nuda]